ncbi:MAG: SCO family protein [Burkholderiales bacterium]|nr:SCO family protein [Burkholderiales bacterium]
MFSGLLRTVDKLNSKPSVALTVVLLCLALAACDLAQNRSSGFNAIDITGADYGKDFRLSDASGKTRTLADFRGKAVLLFFGFTHCPDVCPTTLADAAKVVKTLGADGERVQVLFVTLDPKRDTPAVLAQYIPAFHPGFVGLYGDEATTRKTAKDFRIFYEQRPGSTPDSYSIDHTAATLVFDPQGRLRLFVNNGMAPDKIAADIRKLLL